AHLIAPISSVTAHATTPFGTGVSSCAGNVPELGKNVTGRTHARPEQHSSSVSLIRWSTIAPVRSCTYFGGESSFSTSCSRQASSSRASGITRGSVAIRHPRLSRGRRTPEDPARGPRAGTDGGQD